MTLRACFDDFCKRSHILAHDEGDKPQTPPSEIGKLLDDMLQSYGVAPDAPVTAAEKRLRAAVERMEEDSDSHKESIVGQQYELANEQARREKAEREREELKRRLETAHVQIKPIQWRCQPCGRVLSRPCCPCQAPETIEESDDGR